jgi:selenide,water dikinase
VDLAALARRAGARLVRAVAQGVDAVQRVVHVEGEDIQFDVCSLDVGCDDAGAELPGVAQHAVTLRPMARVIELRARLDALIAAGRPLAVVIVGAGAEGVEVALALRQRLSAAGVGGTVSLVERGTEVLREFEPAMRRLALDVLGERGVSLVLGGRVTAVTGDAVTLHNGASLPADLVVWVTGAAAPSLLARSALALDSHGYLLVDRTLRAVDGTPVLGAGACVTVKDYPDLAKAGIYAMREAPSLDRSLRAALGHGRPARFRPQRSYLALLDTGGGWALMRWKGICRHSRWAARLKDMIDRRFMRRYRESDETAAPAS